MESNVRKVIVLFQTLEIEWITHQLVVKLHYVSQSFMECKVTTAFLNHRSAVPNSNALSPQTRKWRKIGKRVLKKNSML